MFTMQQYINGGGGGGGDGGLVDHTESVLALFNDGCLLYYKTEKNGGDDD